MPVVSFKWLILSMFSRIWMYTLLQLRTPHMGCSVDAFMRYDLFNLIFNPLNWIPLFPSKYFFHHLNWNYSYNSNFRCSTLLLRFQLVLHQDWLVSTSIRMWFVNAWSSWTLVIWLHHRPVALSVSNFHYSYIEVITLFIRCFRYICYGVL